MKTDVIANGLENLTKMLESHIIDNKEQRQENKDEHTSIMKKQDHTNGTVTEHERKISEIKTEHAETLAYLKGMLKVLTWAAIVTPCIVGFIFSLFIANLRNDITKEINTAIDNNNQKQFDEYIK